MENSEQTTNNELISEAGLYLQTITYWYSCQKLSKYYKTYLNNILYAF
jgi:hypothetical protein